MSAFVRIVVPETRTGGLTQSSYLRLGAYSSDEENLVTGLTTTTSSDSSSNISAISSANSSADPSSSTGDKTASVTDTQTGSYTTQNLGVLAYTDKDFQANVQGAALMKIGNGHTTEVTNADAKYQVDQGGYTLNAANNIKIYAGYNGTPANLELTASDYIKQTAQGPLSVMTYGNSDSQTIGNTSDFYLGTKFSMMVGTETTLNLDVTLTVSLEYAISVAMGGTVGLNIGFENSLILGNQIQLQEGIYFKQVTGSYINTVVGGDFKVATTSMKVLSMTDFKIAPQSDLKTVGLNGTICDTKCEIVTSELEGKTLSAAQMSLLAKVEDMSAVSGDFEVRTKGSILHM